MPSIVRTQIIFREINSKFNRQYAKEYNFGRESHDNQYANWSVTYAIPEDVIDILINKHVDFDLKIKDNNGDELSFIIKDMCVVDFIIPNNKSIKCAVSEELLIRTHKSPNLKYNIMRFYFKIKDNIEFNSIGNSIFIIKENIPKELLQCLVNKT